MKGVPVAAHQSRRRREKRKFVSMMRSPSDAVVSEIAPRCRMASSLRPESAERESQIDSVSERAAKLRLSKALGPISDTAPAPPNGS
jgi:hypothetical protein